MMMMTMTILIWIQTPLIEMYRCGQQGASLRTIVALGCRRRRRRLPYVRVVCGHSCLVLDSLFVCAAMHHACALPHLLLPLLPVGVCSTGSCATTVVLVVVVVRRARPPRSPLASTAAVAYPLPRLSLFRTARRKWGGRCRAGVWCRRSSSTSKTRPCQPMASAKWRCT